MSHSRNCRVGAGIVSTLWKAYEKFFASKKPGDKSDEGIFISMPRSPNTTRVVLLGRDFHTYDDFSMWFEQMVREAGGSQLIGLNKKTIADIETSMSWRKI